MGPQSAERLDWVTDLPEGLSVGSLAATKNLVFLATQRQEPPARVRHELWGLARNSGEVVWKHEIPEGVVPEGLAVAGGKLYVSATDGRITCLGVP